MSAEARPLPVYHVGHSAGLPGTVGHDRWLGAAYAVSLPVFEGPLDLLLHLIEQDRLDISEISLVAVTDQYLRTLAQLDGREPGALADFLMTASRLLYLKSLRLLPARPGDDEEDEDMADDLVRHLMEYRQFKRVAETLRALDDEGSRLFGRPAGAPLVDIAKPAPEFGDLELELLQQALRRALARTPDAPSVHKVQPYTVTVADRIETVRSLLARVSAQPGRAAISFSGLLDGATSRIEIIVTFLAVLELVKQAEVIAAQSDTFGEILLTQMERRDGSDRALTASEDHERNPEETGPHKAGDA